MNSRILPLAVTAVALLTHVPLAGQDPKEESAGSVPAVATGANSATTPESDGTAVPDEADAQACTMTPELPDGARWTGECSEGAAQGPGFLVLEDGGLWEALFVDGLAQSRWVFTATDGTVYEGNFVDGKRQGRWTTRFGDETGGGIYIEGEQHGRWQEFFADSRGTRGVSEGVYANGVRQGKWTTRFANGTVHEGPWEDGKRQGKWSHRYASGSVQEGTYKDGTRHGQWMEKDADGNIEQGPYEEGSRQGEWLERDADGWRRTRTYVDGQINGWATTHDPDGELLAEGAYDEEFTKQGPWKERVYDHGVGYAQGTYVDGVKEDRWRTTYSNGRVEEGSYSGGERDGSWTIEFREYGQRIVHAGPYRDGKRHGSWVERVEETEQRYGSTHRGAYKDGVRDGVWREESSNGDYMEGPYKDGKKQGHWVEFDAKWLGYDYGRTDAGSYVDGLKHGVWRYRDVDWHQRNGEDGCFGRTEWVNGEEKKDPWEDYRCCGGTGAVNGDDLWDRAKFEKTTRRNARRWRKEGLFPDGLCMH